MKFDVTKHKVSLGPTNELKQMVDEDDNPIPGAMGSSGVTQGELGADKIVLSPGSGFPLHTHPGAHTLFVLKGKGFLNIDGEDHVMKRGDLFSVPAEYPHGMRAGRNTWLYVLSTGHPHKHIDDKERSKTVKE